MTYSIHIRMTLVISLLVIAASNGMLACRASEPLPPKGLLVVEKASQLAEVSASGATRLTIRQFDESDYAQLARFTDVQELTIESGTYRNKTLETIAQLPQIAALDLSGARELVDADIGLLSATKIKALSLSGANITGACFRLVAKMPTLDELRISYCRSFKSTNLSLLHKSAIRALWLSDCEGLGDEVIDDALSIVTLVELRLVGLDLHRPSISGKGSDRVTSLSFSRCTKLSGEALSLLDKFPNLADLDLTGVPIGETGCAHVLKLGKLKSLDLSATQLSDAAFDSLTALKSLKILSVASTGIGSATLSKITGALDLTELYAYDCRNLDDGVVTGLIAASHLITLDVSMTKLSPAGSLRLSESKTLKSVTLRSMPLFSESDYEAVVKGLAPGIVVVRA
ncbi:MAG: hypothetical protein IPP14_01375 [Planctomycetes bacterium]|nr:hypothetical protein [Planctomycetota bacterium]